MTREVENNIMQSLRNSPLIGFSYPTKLQAHQSNMLFVCKISNISNAIYFLTYLLKFDLINFINTIQQY